MTYSVYQHWDPLKVMAVGISYPPEFYDYIKNEKVRKVFYQIAEETEEDYQKLINLLESFGVQTVRPDIDPIVEEEGYNIKNNNNIQPPYTMTPRDFSLMLGDKFYCTSGTRFDSIINLVKSQGNNIFNNEDVLIGNWRAENFNSYMNGAMTTRLGKDLYFGTYSAGAVQVNGSISELEYNLQSKFPEYRVTVIDTKGHSDGSFCPVVPGLILSIAGSWLYSKTFPDWEVVYLRGESWNKIHPFLNLKKKNNGKWWVPGQELNDDFTDYVETWMKHWVGYVEESVFDVNMIVVDKQNVIVNGYNKTAFDAFSRYGITPHICNFRHRYFWDGGLHCITSDLHREGVMEDYFPERGK